jgi:hypothetical protein
MKNFNHGKHGPHGRRKKKNLTTKEGTEAHKGKM